MSELSDALEAWRTAGRNLDATMAWTAVWLRARMVEEERRLAHLALASEDEAAEPDGETVEWSQASPPRDYRTIGVS